MEIDNIQDYFNITKNAETVTQFFALMQQLAYFPDNFDKEMAEKLLEIIDNEQENLKELATVFRNAGESVKIIPEENWDKLRRKVLLYL